MKSRNSRLKSFITLAPDGLRAELAGRRLGDVRHRLEAVLLPGFGRALVGNIGRAGSLVVTLVLLPTL
jgi:hypothetical protein